MVWHDDDHLTIGDTNFLVTLDWEISNTAESTSEEFVLLKNRWNVETTMKHLPEPVHNMIEFGIFKGGSIALYEELFSPARLIGVDIQEERVEALDRYLEKRQATDRVRLYYGTNQADQKALRAIAQENFGDRSLDLVIDDGSHLYEPSKTSLNVFLPYLRPNGIYLIEDWSWAHWQVDEKFQEYVDDQKCPMTRLVFEAVMLAASRSDIISDIFIDPSRVVLTCGHGVITEENFDIATAHRTGRWKMEFSARTRPLDLWRRWVPYSLRRHIPRSFARWAREHIPL